MASGARPSPSGTRGAFWWFVRRTRGTVGASAQPFSPPPERTSRSDYEMAKSTSLSRILAVVLGLLVPVARGHQHAVYQLGRRARRRVRGPRPRPACARPARARVGSRAAARTHAPPATQRVWGHRCSRRGAALSTAAALSDHDRRPHGQHAAGQRPGAHAYGTHCPAARPCRARQHACAERLARCPRAHAGGARPRGAATGARSHRPGPGAGSGGRSRTCSSAASGRYLRSCPPTRRATGRPRPCGEGRRAGEGRPRGAAHAAAWFAWPHAVSSHRSDIRRGTCAIRERCRAGCC
jgi:hypothetical protein